MIHPADRGDTTTLATTLDDAPAKLCAVRDKEDAPGIDEPFALVAAGKFDIDSAKDTGDL